MVGTPEGVIDRAAASLARFQPALVEVVSRGRTLDIRAYEMADTPRILADLGPAVSGLLGEARTALGAILDACGETRAEPSADLDGVAQSEVSFEHAIDATVASGLGSREAVEEVAFMADMELGSRQRRLGGLSADASAATVLEECDSCLRRVRKALTAVDAAIAGAEQVDPRLDYTSELESSLAVRRAYAKFRRRILEGGEPTEDDLYARFRAAGTQLAILVGWDAWPEMRTRDRLLLRSLQHRILDWLRSPSPDTTAGLRLWSDLSACLEMMTLVNRRQELVEHDAEVLRFALGRLREARGLDDTTRRLLASLEGLDKTLDLLLAEADIPAEAWRPVLERLAERFERPAPSEPAW
jgi:hypothetical protein